MNFLQFLSDQIKRLQLVFAIAYIPIILVLGAAALQTRVNPGHLIRDPATFLQIPFYYGLLSNLGILIWWAAAVVCFFCVLTLKSLPQERGWTNFFGFAGTLTTFLVLDDFFLLHEDVYPRLLGIPEKVVYLAYGIATLAFLVQFRKKIFQTDFVLLGLALGFFAISTLIDTFTSSLPSTLLQSSLRYLVEDGFKLLGIASWTAYFARAGLQVLRYHMAKTEVSLINSNLKPEIEAVIIHK